MAGSKTCSPNKKRLLPYDATLHFCNLFFRNFDGTREQMIHDMRSGKQNILEGSEPFGTSQEIEMKLGNTSRGTKRDHSD
jgi:hypothetical protein